MSVKAVKGILWAVVAIGFAMIFATASPAFDRSESIALFSAACALLIAAVLWYKRVIPAAEARDEKATMRQVAVLKQQVVLTGQPIEVRLSSGILLPVMMICVVIAFGYQAFAVPSIESVAMFAVALALTSCLALWSRRH